MTRRRAQGEARDVDGAGDAPVADRLRGYLQRIGAIRDQRALLNADARALDAEIKSAGFAPKILRQIARARGMDAAVLAEGEALLALYARACGVTLRPDADDAAGEISVLATEALRLHAEAEASGAMNLLKKSRAAREAALADGAAAAGIRRLH